MDDYDEQDVLNNVTDEMVEKRYLFYFKEHKDKFKQFIKENKFVSISYENLYYGDDVEIIKKHFNFYNNIEFPLNNRHLKRDGVPVEPKKLKVKFL